MEKQITVIVTTSPIPSNPSTEMIETVFQSFDLVEGLKTCPKILVCDGFRLIKTASCYKSGKIKETHAETYKLFVQKLKELIETNPAFCNTRILELTRRNGFAYAVKEALELVSTPFVLVVQHDFVFLKRCSTLPALIEILSTSVANYLVFPSHSTKNYVEKVKQKFKYKNFDKIKVLTNTGPIDLVPLYFWYDRTHLASKSYYMNEIFSKNLVKFGDFIEDTLGHRIMDDIKLNGAEKHDLYRTFIYFMDGVDDIVVGHLNGRKYIENEAKLKFQKNKGDKFRDLKEMDEEVKDFFEEKKEK